MAGIELKSIAQLWIFLSTYVAAEVFLFIAIRLANRFQLVDKPTEERKIHEFPIPTIGGIPIFLAFFVGLYFSQEGWEVMRYPVIGAGVCMVLGLIDDIKPISAVLKLAILFGITWYINYASNGALQVRLTPWESANLILTLFWVVGMMSALNSLDNMDGLASGITAIACFFMFLVAWTHWDRFLSFMAVALCASCLTFLKYNFFQARAGIFLGDNGSYFLGFALATMAVMGAWTNPRLDFDGTERYIKALIVPTMVLAVPIFDIITATTLRLVNKEVSTVKEAIVYCGTDHTSHRLVALGFSRRQAVLILWAVAAGLGVMALVVQNTASTVLYLSITVVGLAGLVLFAMILNRARVYSHQLPAKVSPNESAEKNA
jgi:UDP-GlcNAc:undecaprenyl-phosphate GlcNAc-1-phosphate transferase